MNKPFIILMSGLPASGKTTAATQFIKWYNASIYDSLCTIVSRDNIRFQILKTTDPNFNISQPYDTEKYFSQEQIVFDRFIYLIKNNIFLGFNVIADATHIDYYSRIKVYNALEELKNKVDIFLWIIETPKAECLKRNKTRIGVTRVPRSSILSLFNSKEYPTTKEQQSYIKAVFINKSIYKYDWRNN